MKPFETENIPDDIPTEFSFTKAEYWALISKSKNEEKESKRALSNIC